MSRAGPKLTSDVAALYGLRRELRHRRPTIVATRSPGRAELSASGGGALSAPAGIDAADVAGGSRLRGRRPSTNLATSDYASGRGAPDAVVRQHGGGARPECDPVSARRAAAGSAASGRVEYLTREFRSPHPLADEQFETDGVSLFVERLGFLNVSAPGQFAMREILSALLRRVERDERGLAVRLYPFSRRPALPALADSPKLVVIDPRVSFGRPVLVGTGVTTSTIAERFDAGESIEELAADYGRPPTEIQEAIRCELTRDAA